MKIDFNNVRIQAGNAYNIIAERLNEELKEGNIEATLLQNAMDMLRSCLIGICCSYQEGDENCRSVIDEVDGSRGKGYFVTFNDEQ